MNSRWNLASAVRTFSILSLLFLSCEAENPVTVKPTSSPDPPTSFTAIPGDGVVTLRWVRPSGAPGVRIVRLAGVDPSSPDDGAKVYEGANNEFVDQGVTNGTEYHYAAYSYDSRMKFSNAVRQTARPAPDTTPPRPVSGVAVQARERGARLTWQNPTDSDFDVVVVVRRTVGCPGSLGDGTEVYRGNGTSHTSTDLPGKTTHYFAIWALDTSGNSSSRVCAPAVTTIAQYMNVTVPAFSIADEFPQRWRSSTSTCDYVDSGQLGDCEFSGHGPKVCAQAEATVVGGSVEYRVRFAAVEEVSDYTACGFTWRSVHTADNVIPSGWSFDPTAGYVTSRTSSLSYTDTDTGFDYLSGSGGLVSQWVILGDTNDGDVCNNTEDDTHVHSMQFNGLTIRVWR